MTPYAPGHPRYNPDGWPHEDPRFPLDDWKHEVQSDDTRLGYEEWLRHRLQEQGGIEYGN